MCKEPKEAGAPQQIQDQPCSDPEQAVAGGYIFDIVNCAWTNLKLQFGTCYDSSDLVAFAQASQKLNEGYDEIKRFLHPEDC